MQEISLLPLYTIIYKNLRFIARVCDTKGPKCLVQNVSDDENYYAFEIPVRISIQVIVNSM